MVEAGVKEWIKIIRESDFSKHRALVLEIQREKWYGNPRYKETCPSPTAFSWLLPF